MNVLAQFDCSWHHLRQIHSITINFLQGVPFFAASNAAGERLATARRTRRSVAPAGGFRQNTPSTKLQELAYQTARLRAKRCNDCRAATVREPVSELLQSDTKRAQTSRSTLRPFSAAWTSAAFPELANRLSPVWSLPPDDARFCRGRSPVQAPHPPVIVES
jgi:hypothetical protein